MYEVNSILSNVDPEPWAKNAELLSSSAHFNNYHATEMDGDATIVQHDDFAWSPSIDGHTGVMILHPLAPQKPATITLSPQSNLSGSGKTARLRIVMRGSHITLGSRLVVRSPSRVIHETPVHDTWSMEYAYIDSIAYESR